MLQMTTGKNHGVNIEGVASSLESGVFAKYKAKYPETPVTLLFVVPMPIFERFEFQPLHRLKRTAKGSTKADHDQQAARIKREVCQAVMGIDLSERLKTIKQFHQQGLKQSA